jgi:hypothetical protein
MNKAVAQKTSHSTKHNRLIMLARDEQGAVMLEFIIVLYVFLFLLLGILQFGLLGIASYYVNYSNYMACRTAAVHLDQMENGVITKQLFNGKILEQAALSLGPLEPQLWKDPTNTTKLHDVKKRIQFYWRNGGTAISQPDGTVQKGLRGRLEYRYYLVVPFMNGLIAAFQHSFSSQDDQWVFEKAQSGEPYPSITLTSNFDLTIRTASESPPYDHPMNISRRWVY